jgi:hypothetical protein
MNVWPRELWRRLKGWWNMRFTDSEIVAMRQEIRNAVHENRSLATQAKWESRRAAQASTQATQVARDAIFRLEQAKQGLKQNEVPPS